MVFIHGGGWMCGDSTTEMYGPEFILDRDVLLVTINYRLGKNSFPHQQFHLHQIDLTRPFSKMRCARAQ